MYYFTSQTKKRRGAPKETNGMERKMSKTKFAVKFQKAAAVFAAVLVFAGMSFAGDSDKLINMLADKGIITSDEAQQLQKESGKTLSIPEWIQNIKFNADLRLRHQADWTGTSTRVRERLRLRFGFEANPVENMTAAFGLATGKTSGGADSDPASTNYSFQGFQKVPIFVDYAYLRYNIAGIVKINAGKVKNDMAFWNIRQLIWDTDINPDGVTVNVDRSLGKGFAFFGNAGWLFMNGDIGNGAEQPDVYVFQPGINYKTGNISVKAAMGYQQFNTKNRIPAVLAPGNANYLQGHTNLTNFQIIDPAVEVKAKEIIGRYGVTVFGEYIKNLDDSVYKTDREGGLYGITFGDDKIGKLADWNITLAGRYLMNCVIPAYLGYSDAYNGAPNARGYEISANFGLTKKAAVTLTYLDYKAINGPEDRASLMQFDLNYKF